MAELQQFEVRLSNGLKGTVLRSSRFLDKREFNTVKLSNGTDLTVPSAALEPQQDGSFFLRDGPTTTGAQAEGGAAEDQTTIDPSVFKEDVEVQRVPVNRVLDAPAEPRVEDGVTIIPVMEERLKVEKQLFLREEIRIVKKRTSMRDPRLVALAKELADASSREPKR
jgi:hypothetical protein